MGKLGSVLVGGWRPGCGDGGFWGQMRRRLSVVPVLLLLASTLVAGLSTSSAATTLSHGRRVPGQTTWPGPTPSGPQQSHTKSLRPAWTASNWSGYAVTGSGIASIVGNWSVPTVLRPHGRRQQAGDLFSGTWAGIDGFLPANGNFLIQAGTEQDWLAGSTFYQSWWEVITPSLALPEQPIPSVPVHPGDSITVTITQGVPNWTITLRNNTTGSSFTTNQPYSGPQQSAEWIQEAVTVNGFVSAMPRYSPFSFDNGEVNGASARLSTSNAGAMVQGRHRVSTPSAPDSDGNGFSVRYGSRSPSAPSS